MIGVIDSAKEKNIPDDSINSALHIAYSDIELSNAVSSASEFQCIYSSNMSIIKSRVENYCVGENAQYKGVMESFMKSNTTSTMERDIALLEFALSILKDRLSVSHDGVTAFLTKANDVLNRLKPPP